MLYIPAPQLDSAHRSAARLCAPRRNSPQRRTSQLCAAQLPATRRNALSKEFEHDQH
jgi:hypothetical protein